MKNFFKGDLALVNYEMINPNDAFGKVMLENLEVSVNQKINNILFRTVVADCKASMMSPMKPLKTKECKMYLE
jgi:hypothetical protein